MKKKEFREIVKEGIVMAIEEKTIEIPKPKKKRKPRVKKPEVETPQVELVDFTDTEEIILETTLDTPLHQEEHSTIEEMLGSLVDDRIGKEEETFSFPSAAETIEYLRLAAAELEESNTIVEEAQSPVIVEPAVVHTPNEEEQHEVVVEHVVMETSNTRHPLDLHLDRPGYNPYNNNPYNRYSKLGGDVFRWDSTANFRIR